MLKSIYFGFISAFLALATPIQQNGHDKELTNNLLGSWTMCRSGSTNKKNNKTSSFIRNVCPGIVFNNSVGDIRMGNGVVSVFKWKVDNGHLIISEESNKDSAIPNGKYDISYRGKEMILSSTKESIEADYFLDRKL